MMFFRKKKPAAAAETQSPSTIFSDVRDAILQDALARSADAIKIVPDRHAVAIHMRVGGQWQEVQQHRQGFYRYVVLAFKKTAGIPDCSMSAFQMGLMLLERDGAEYEAYATFFPTRYGCRITILLQPASDTPTMLTPADLLSM